jgi:hypothetical protein
MKTGRFAANLAVAPIAALILTAAAIPAGDTTLPVGSWRLSALLLAMP